MHRPRARSSSRAASIGDVRALGEALTLGRELARSAPLRWPAREALDRQEETARHLDFAVRNTRVLARDTVRYLRGDGTPVPDLADAVGDLAQALWALAAAFTGPDPPKSPVVSPSGAAHARPRRWRDTPTSRSRKSPGRSVRSLRTWCGQPRLQTRTRPGWPRPPPRNCSLTRRTDRREAVVGVFDDEALRLRREGDEDHS